MTDNIRALMTKIRGLLGGRRAELEFDDEIQAHIELLTDRYIRQGMTRDEAASAARRQFGNLTLLKEANREMRGMRFIDTIFQDLRYGVRMLGRNPRFTLIAVLTFALGIGANTAIFSVVNAVLLRSLPYHDPDRLVLLNQRRPEEGNRGALSLDFLQWREQAKSFEQIAAYSSATLDLTGSGEAERLSAGTATANLFATLGVAPALGRNFTQAEEAPGGAPVVVLSDSLWRRRFGGDPGIIGQAITLGGKSRTVIGVMPYEFQFSGKADLWVPLVLDAARDLKAMQPSIYNISDHPYILNVLARLKPGATTEAARAELSVILEQQRQAFPHVYADALLRVVGLKESLNIGNVRLAFLMLLGAVSFVLLIACANVANLLLARSAARQKEMAIRASVGAGRLRLVRQLLTESMLLSLLGGGAGLLAAYWGVNLLVEITPAKVARIEEASVDGHVLGFTCAVALLAGLIAGLFPALQATKTDLNETLKIPSGAGSARAVRAGLGFGRRILPSLMITELALALVLLVGAGLFINSFLRILSVPKGYDPDGVLTLGLEPSETRYPRGSAQLDAYYREAVARVRALPGIQSAAMGGLPLWGPWFMLPLRIEGRPPERGKEPIVLSRGAGPGYYRTMSMQMRAGRPCGEQDRGAKVAIINETLARRFFPNENPLGHRLLWGNDPLTIIGIAGDSRNASMDREPAPEVNTCGEHGYLIARVSPEQNNPAGLANMAAAIRKQVSALDPNEPINQVETMDEVVSKTLAVAGRRYLMLLLGIFAAIAFVIATVGIYGVISYGVSQRTNEIGIRMALGAQAGDVLRMVMTRGMGITLTGVVLGLALALALTQVLRRLLFGVSASDPATYIAITLLIVGVALIASYIPARRATKIDPLQALRHE